MIDNNPQKNICYFALTPELVSQIYKEAKKAFLKKDGTPFKRYKCFWIKNLIDIVAKNLALNKEVVEIAINELSYYLFLVKDYRDEIHYFPIYEEHIRDLNKRLKAIGQVSYSTKRIYIETWKQNGITYKSIDGFEVYSNKK